MSVLRLANAHQSQLEQLTGCRYATLRSLVLQVRERLHQQHQQQRRGRPFQNSVLVMTTLALMKLRQNLTVRALQAITGIDAVTISRCVNRIVAILGKLPLAVKTIGCLLVDSTSARVATTQLKAYSGYKHHRCAKLQVIASQDGRIVDVSPSFAGSVHDKSIWNKEATRIKHLFGQLVLGDKAYAGGTGEGACLLRPIKRGENKYKEDPTSARSFNRQFSKIRVRIEHVFARLKTWKTLSGLFLYRWERLSEIVRAIAVVHNMNRVESLKLAGATH